MRRTRSLAVALSATLLALTTACSSGGTAPADQSSSGGASDGKVKVGVVLKTLSSEYWSYVAAGVKAAEKDLNAEVVLQGPASETAYDEQTSMLETMKSDPSIKALVVSPLQPASVVSVLDGAEQPVVFVDTDAPFEAKKSYVGTGNEAAAFKGGQWAAQKVGGKGKAVLIGGVQGNTASDQREKGFTDALQQGGVQVVSKQYGEGLADKAAAIMENQITSLGRDIQVVVCHNDETAAGASRALQQAGLKNVQVVGFDGIQAGVQNVIDGKVAATAAQAP